MLHAGTPSLLTDMDGKPVTAIWNGLSIATNAAMDRIFLQYSPDLWMWRSDPSMRKQPIFLDVINLQGVVLNSYSRPPGNFSVTSPDWLHQFYIRTSPPVPALVGTIFRQVFPSDIPEFNSPEYPRPAWVVAPGELPILFGVSLVLTIVDWFQASRAGFSARRSWQWMLFVFCCGLPAFITSESWLRLQKVIRDFSHFL